jgi:hypothetical protein
LNSNLEKFKEELMEKTLQETTKAIEKSVCLKSNVSTCTTIHEGSKCTLCGISPIVGYRYHCNVCKYFDLCTECEEKSGESHPHPLLKFRKSNNNSGKNKMIGCNLQKQNDWNEKNSLKIVFEKLGIMKQQYDLSAFSDKKICDVLIECKGNIDEAFEKLFK